MDIARELKLIRSPLGTQLTVICIFHVELPDPLPRRVVLGCPLTDDPDTVKQTGYEPPSRIWICESMVRRG